MFLKEYSKVYMKYLPLDLASNHKLITISKAPVNNFQ